METATSQAEPEASREESRTPVGGSTPWLTVREAARYASLSIDTIYTACERGELRHARVSGRRTIRLRTEWIDAWLERHTRFEGEDNNHGPLQALQT